MKGNRLSPRSVAWLAIVAVLGLVWLPPGHVHSVSDHGEQSEVIHRHLAPHHASGTDASFDHSESAARYLSSPFTTEASPHIRPVDQPLAPPLFAPEPQSPLGWPLSSLHVRVHDPPWISSLGLRGPPLRV